MGKSKDKLRYTGIHTGHIGMYDILVASPTWGGPPYRGPEILQSFERDPQKSTTLGNPTHLKPYKT